jgi:predicted phosphate transport protein (TIGR00153 family)
MGLFDIFTAKQRRIQGMMQHYMNMWMDCIRTYRDAWEIYLVEGACDNFAYKVDATHKKESEADDARRELEHELYSKALLPESRGDILRVVESVDKLAGLAENVLYEIHLQEMKIPKELIPNFNKMVDLSCCSCDQVNNAVLAVFVHHKHADDLRECFRKIDEIESESDHVERRLVRAIFKLDMRPGNKVIYKDLVRELAKITDDAERVADRLNIVNVKRRV